MAKNDIIEMGSKANIVLSFVEDVNILGKDYAALEPYLYLKNARVILNYKQNKKTATSGKHIMNFNINDLDSVKVGDIAFSKKIAALFVCFTENNSVVEKREFSTETAYSGKIYMSNEIYNAASIYVYDSNFDKIPSSSFSYDSLEKSISSTEFVDGEDYLISFSSELSGTRFELKQENFPVMQMEIQGEGNINKITKKVLLNLGKVSLNSAINFNFIPGSQINIPLDFKIIDDSNNFIVFED